MLKVTILFLKCSSAISIYAFCEQTWPRLQQFSYLHGNWLQNVIRQRLCTLLQALIFQIHSITLNEYVHVFL
jgi:hypothetical protein